MTKILVRPGCEITFSWQSKAVGSRRNYVAANGAEQVAEASTSHGCAAGLAVNREESKRKVGVEESGRWKAVAGKSKRGQGGRVNDLLETVRLLALESKPTPVRGHLADSGHMRKHSSTRKIGYLNYLTHCTVCEVIRYPDLG